MQRQGDGTVGAGRGRQVGRVAWRVGAGREREVLYLRGGGGLLSSADEA